MNQTAALNQFLMEIEKRAFNMARISTGNTDDALDIVQDCMLTLVRRYASKPASEWRPLFFRILHNRVCDHHRRSARHWRWYRRPSAEPADVSQGRFESDAVNGIANALADPAERSALDASITALDAAIAALPLRQQQAFLLRGVETLSVQETAQAMGCSEGSVKTHFARANEALREQLKDHWT